MWSGVGGHKTVDEQANPRLPMRLEAEDIGLCRVNVYLRFANASHETPNDVVSI
jgi:hypothetical protein